MTKEFYSSNYVAEFLSKKDKGVTAKEKAEVKEIIKGIILADREKRIKEGREEDDEEDVYLEFPDKVIAFFTPLMKNIIKKRINKDKERGFNYQNDDYNDLVQEAYSGLLYGLSKYNPDKPNTPTTYVHFWIVNYIQKFRNRRMNIVKPDSVYHSLMIFVKKHIEDGLNVDEILEFFPKANKKNGDWVYPPEEVKITHSSIKKSTVIKHITYAVQGGQSNTVNQTEENQFFIDSVAYKSKKEKMSVNLNGSVKNFSIYEFKDVVIQMLRQTDKYTDDEKNLFIEYFSLGKPVFTTFPNIIIKSNVDFESYSSKRKKISKGVYFADKYDISRSKVKKIIEGIVEEIRPVILSHLD